MAAHRYWRIYATAGNGESNMGLAEIQLRASLGGADETGSGTASASSGTSPGNLVDNSDATTWTTTGGAYPHWWAYDFGSGNDKDISEIAINARAQIRFAPTEFQLQYSDDGSGYTTLFT